MERTTRQDPKTGAVPPPPAWRPWDRLLVALDRWHPPETAVLVATAVVVGLGGGLAAVAFRELIALLHRGFFEGLAGPLSALGPAYVLLVPAIGGLLVGPIVVRYAEVKGSGVPEVMEAVALDRGRIRPVVMVVKALASALCIGSGGSAGREGPIVQIGSALGSTVGQTLRLSDERMRSLVACGAAAGVAATFNTPIAGVLFALEVILGQFSSRYFSTVVVAAVTASVVGRAAFGDVPAFTVPEYALVSPWELPLYAALGAVAGLAAIVFVRTLYRFVDAWERTRLPPAWRPAAGGLAVGAIGLFVPDVFGVGYEAIDRVLLGGTTLGVGGLLLLLAGLKIVATSLTIGSGGSGGVFAPSLFVGAMVGSAFGATANALLPGITASPGAYALVGMSALFAGTAHAPITAVIMLFELTGDYRIILPLMLATGVSTLLSQWLSRDSIYTLKLTRRGVRLEHGRDIDVMQSVQVGEAMSTAVDIVDADLSLADLDVAFRDARQNAFPVVDETGQLFGIVALQDLDLARRSEDSASLRVRDIATRSLVIAYPDEPVRDALRRMGTRDLGRLPVVERRDPKRLVGVIGRRDIVRAYKMGIAHKLETQAHTERLRLDNLTGSEFVDVAVTPGGPVAGQPVKALALPEECVLVSIRRDERLLIPHGDTILLPGDHVTALVGLPAVTAFRRLFDATAAEPPTNAVQEREVT